MWTTREEFVDADGQAMIYTPIQKSLREVIEDIGRDIEGTAGTGTEISAEDTGSLESMTEGWLPVPPSPAEVDCFYDLLTKMLQIEPQKRINIEEVAKHPWFTTKFER
jgi:serine/threonine protein kinase